MECWLERWNAALGTGLLRSCPTRIPEGSILPDEASEVAAVLSKVLSQLALPSALSSARKELQPELDAFTSRAAHLLELLPQFILPIVFQGKERLLVRLLLACARFATQEPAAFWTSPSLSAPARAALECVAAKHNLSVSELYATRGAAWLSELALYLRVGSATKDSLEPPVWKTHVTPPFELLFLLHSLSSAAVRGFCRLCDLSLQIRRLFPSLLPLVLPLVDDHEAHHRCLGLRLLDHCIRHVPPAVLKTHRRLLQTALHSNLHARETAVLEHAMPCLLRLLTLTSLRAGDDAVKEVLTHVTRDLDFLSLGSDPKDRGKLRVLLNALPTLLLLLQLHSLPLWRPLLEALLRLLNTHAASLDMVDLTLTALTALLQAGWPVVRHHMRKITESLVVLALRWELRVPLLRAWCNELWTDRQLQWAEPKCTRVECMVSVEQTLEGTVKLLRALVC